MPKLLTASIAMCTYNGNRYLQGQLQSILDQTRRPDELIICDDASNDNTLEIIEDFAKTAPFAVRIQKNAKNLGYVKNFEQAIAHCTQDIVFLCDQDDVWQSTKIADVLAVFQAEPHVGMVLHNFTNIDGQGEPYIQAQEQYGTQKLLAEELPEDMRRHSIQSFLLPQSRAWCGCMSAFKREFTNILLPIFEGKGHDDWILKIIAPLSEIRFMAEPLIRYRIHAHNTNSDEFTQKGLSFRLKKFIKKFKNALKGHSKRNFYKQVIQRIQSSGLPIRHPHLIKIYKRYAPYSNTIRSVLDQRPANVVKS